MRLKVVEAMAMGRCVVTTRIGAEGIEVVDGEDVVLADSVSDWIEAFDMLVPAPDGSLEIAQRAQVVAQQRFSLDAVGRQLEEFYREVLA